MRNDSIIKALEHFWPTVHAHSFTVISPHGARTITWSSLSAEPIRLWWTTTLQIYSSSQRCSTCRWVSRFAATIHVTKSVTHNWLHRFTVLVYFGKYMFMANTIIMISDDWKGLLWLLTTKFKSAYDHFLQAEEEIPLRCCLALTYCIDNNRMKGRMDKESRNILYNIIT